MFVYQVFIYFTVIVHISEQYIKIYDNKQFVYLTMLSVLIGMGG